MSEKGNSPAPLEDRYFTRAFQFDYGTLDDGKIWVSLPDNHIFQIDKLTLGVMLDINAGKTIKESSKKYGIDQAQIEFLVRKINDHRGIVSENSGRINRFTLSQDSDIAGYAIIFFAMAALQAHYFLFRSHTVLMASLWEGVAVAALALGAVFFHEMGHYVATWHFTGIRPRMGFEINLIFPSIYVDTHNAWRLPRNKRLVINSSGMFADMAVNTVAVAAVLCYPPLEYFVTPFLITQYTRWSILLNPFFKGDGYWMLSDILGLVNMEKKGIEELRRLKFSPLSMFGLVSIALSVLSVIGLAWFFLNLAGSVARGILAKVFLK